MSTTGEIVASYTFVIVKGGTFRVPFTFTDENSAPIDFSNLQVDVEPNIGAATKVVKAVRVTGKVTNASALWTMKNSRNVGG